MCRLLLAALLISDLLTACTTSKRDDLLPDALAAPQVEGEWQVIRLETAPGYADDSSANMALRLALASTIRPLSAGRVQLPRWVFRPDGKIIVRWAQVGRLPRRSRLNGVFHRQLISHQTIVRTRVGVPAQEITFAGDTLVLHDTRNHLMTRMLPVY